MNDICRVSYDLARWDEGEGWLNDRDEDADDYFEEDDLDFDDEW